MRSDALTPRARRELERILRIKGSALVAVHPPTSRLLDAAKERGRMGGFLCERNSLLLGRTAFALGSREVFLVGGVAFRPPDAEDADHPYAHVWFRIGKRHIDPTWSRGRNVRRLVYVRLIVESIDPGVDPQPSMLRRVGQVIHGAHVEYR